MRRVLIILLLTLLPHIFTTTVVKSSSDGELPWPPLKYENLKFILVNKFSPPNETIVEVAKPIKNDFPFNFGQLNVFDAPFELPWPPTILGRSQGMFIMSDQNTDAFLLSMSLIFSKGLYMGSTLVLLGRYDFSSEVTELPIVGGTGYFSYAQGVCKLDRQINAYPYHTDKVDCDVYYRSLPTSDI